MSKNEISFANLGLKNNIIKSLNDLGYIKPSPIQIDCIPHLLLGHDVLGIAQTGSGKTAAFALPFLNNLNLSIKLPQVLVLTPTRELAIQVGKAFLNFSKYINLIKIAILYGGQSYDLQFKSLKKKPQIVFGTPGRLLDHLRKGTLDLSNLSGLILDEADEMLRMGFIEDVEKILSQIPKIHQTALFSATMPEAIKRIANRFMNKPKEVKIKCNINTRPDILQNYWKVNRIYKKKALSYFLEIENFDAAIVFVKTKNSTIEISNYLVNKGYNSSALNGDMNQHIREKTLNRFKQGDLDILIATDVAARGLDVDRISLVINYDIPLDSESYIHRIGRTGRAGRTGKAILFIENREFRLLRKIENFIKLKIKEINLPNADELSLIRISKFSDKVKNYLKNIDLNVYCNILNKIKKNTNTDIETLSAILLKISEGKRNFIVKQSPFIKKYNKLKVKNKIFKENKNYLNQFDLFSIEIGINDGVEIRHIVGAISNECKINSKLIGNIKLFNYYSIIELKKNISKKIFNKLNKIRILNKFINIKLIKNQNIKNKDKKFKINNYKKIKFNKNKFNFKNKIKNNYVDKKKNKFSK
ncbi:MAG: DEAD/DEAH box helicase [Candidatus Makana argininalis]